MSQQQDITFKLQLKPRQMGQAEVFRQLYGGEGVKNGESVNYSSVINIDYAEEEIKVMSQLIGESFAIKEAEDRHNAVRRTIQRINVLANQMTINQIHQERDTMVQPQAQPGIQPMQKPSWRGLTGGGATPVAEFVGQVGSWGLATNQFGQQVVFKIQQAQILHSDTPYPYAELDLSIRYSESQNSGWGKFGESVATSFGVSMEALDIDGLIGQTIHCVRHDNYTFFVDRQGVPAVGSYWEMVSLVQPGQQVASIYAQVNPAGALVTAPNPNGTLAMPPPMVPQIPTPMAPQPPPAMVPVATQPAPIPPVPVAPVVPVAAPIPTPIVPAPPVAIVAPAILVAPVGPPDGSGAETVAKQLLHGKTLSDFYREAMQSEAIRANPTLSQSILMQTYVESLKQQGVAIENADGTYSVVVL